MKRDWDLIRAILLAASEKEVGMPLYNRDIGGYDEKIVAGHMQMLHDAGYAEVKSPGTNSGFAMMTKIHMPGYDLLDTMNSNALWERIKTGAKEKAVDLSFEAIKALAIQYLPQILS